LSLHFIFRTHYDLMQNAVELTDEFGLQNSIEGKESLSGWKVLRPKLVFTEFSALDPGWPAKIEKMVDIETLWQRYRCRGLGWMRVKRAAPMTFFYLGALWMIRPVTGHFPTPPIIGDFPFFLLMLCTICVFLFLTFFVIDAMLLHEGFLKQLAARQTYWPDTTFKKYEYPFEPNRPNNERDLADYWDILLIARRTEAVGNKIYYPFIILSLLIVARLKYFDNWSWSPALIVALFLHFSVAFYAAWRLPKVARGYRDKVLERLNRRKRQALMRGQKTMEATDAMIEEVQSTHQGAFSYLWEQPVIRALLLPSGGIGLVTLLQYLPHTS
jgi:hypothetical protein